jgi:hypothetical protein
VRRFSTTTSAASAAVAAMMNPSASGDPHPETSPELKNRLIPATPMAMSAAPAQSIRPGATRSGSSAGTAAEQRTTAITPTTRIATKIDWYPKRSER